MSTITITRTVSATPAQVFAAWVDPDRLAGWWWPQLTGTTYEIDARPGGRFRIHAPAAGITAHGEYVEVEAPHRLAFTWNWIREGEPVVDEVDDVVVTFEALDADHTRVTVSHSSALHDDEGGAEQGWNDVMDRLAAADLPDVAADAAG